MRLILQKILDYFWLITEILPHIMNSDMTNIWVDLANENIISQAQYLQIVQYMARRPQNQGVNNLPNQNLQIRDTQLFSERQNLVDIVGQQLFEGDQIRHERDQVLAENQDLQNQVNQNSSLVQILLNKIDQLNADNNRFIRERNQANNDKQGLEDKNKELKEQAENYKKEKKDLQDKLNQANNDKQELEDKNKELVVENNRLKMNNINTQDMVNKRDVKIKRFEFLLSLLDDKEIYELERRAKQHDKRNVKIRQFDFLLDLITDDEIKQ